MLYLIGNAVRFQEALSWCESLPTHTTYVQMKTAVTSAAGAYLNCQLALSTYVFFAYTGFHSNWPEA